MSSATPTTTRPTPTATDYACVTDAYGLDDYVNRSQVNSSFCWGGNGGVIMTPPVWTQCCNYGFGTFVLDNCYQACQVSNSTTELNSTELGIFSRQILSCVNSYDNRTNTTHFGNATLPFFGVVCVNSELQTSGAAPMTHASSASTATLAGVVLLFMAVWRSLP